MTNVWHLLSAGHLVFSHTQQTCNNIKRGGFDHNAEWEKDQSSVRNSSIKTPDFITALQHLWKSKV